MTDTDFLRASRAARRFDKAFAGGLTTVARAATGKRKLRVRAGNLSCTDGRDIYLRPLIELGDELRHEKSLCSKRDEETSVMLCSACSRDDLVLATAFHEMAHIIYESFGQPGDERLEALMARAIGEGRNPDDVKAAAKLGGHVAIAGMLDPHLPWAFNVFEDSRVNALMRAERPGFARMRQAMMHKVTSEGIDGPDGEKVPWRDNAPHLQAGIAAMSMADKTSNVWRPALNPDHVDVIYEDPICQQLAAEIDDVDDSYDVLGVAESLIDRFRELGVLPPKSDGEDQEDDDGNADGDSADGDDDGGEGDQTGDGGAGNTGRSQGQGGRGAGDPADGGADDDDDDSDADSGSQGTSGQGDGDDEDGDARSGGDTPTDEQFAEEVEKAIGAASGHPDGQPTDEDYEAEADGQGGVGGGNPGHNDDEYMDQIFKVAIQQGNWFDEPSTEISGVQFRTFDDPTSSGQYGHLITSHQADQSERKGVLEIVPGVVGPVVSRLRKAFDANKAGGYEQNLTRGRVSRRGLARKLVNDDPRVYRKKNDVTDKSYHVVIMMDMSGSTRDNAKYRAEQWARYRSEPFDPKDTFRYPDGSDMLVFDAMKHLASHLGDMFDRLNISFEIHGHSGYLDYVYVSGMPMGSFDIAPAKRADEGWTSETRRKLAGLQGGSANLDGHAMEFGRKQAEKVDVTDRIVIYMSDGEMPAANGPEEREILERECAYMRKTPGIHCLGIGIHCDSPKEFGLDTVIVNTAHDLKVVAERLEALLS
jgi:hypothetical protein